MPRGSSSSSDNSASVKATVLLDTYSWYENFGDPSSPTNTAERGETITVSQDEFDRAQAMTPRGLAPASEKNPTNEVTIPSDLSELSDKELLELATRLGADVDEKTVRDVLVAAVAAAPGGYERPTA